MSTESLPRVPPGPRGDPILGNFRAMRRDRMHLLISAAREYGDVVRIPIANRVAYLVRHPEGVRHVLQENAANYNKQTRGFDRLRDVLGEGLLTSEGDFWLRQRRIAQPAFHRQRIAAFGTRMVRAAEDMVDAWSSRIDAGVPIDAAKEMMKVALRIVSETLLGTDVSGEANTVGEAIHVILEATSRRILNVLPLSTRIPTPANRRFARALGELDRIVYGMIEQRRGSRESHDDLLGMFMSAQDSETGERMNDKQLRDEVMTMFTAGHETTANALSWTFYLLSTDPLVARTLRDELDRVLGGRAPTVEDLPSLRYTNMVIQESMRLYPPAWILGRAALDRDEIAGYEIPKDALVFVSPYVTHRAPSLWPNPEGFDPERFAPERVASIPRFAYFPFGGGPRQCIGNAFAMMEAQLVLATVARRVRLDLVPGHPVVPEALVTLRPKHGLAMTVTRVGRGD